MAEPPLTLVSSDALAVPEVLKLSLLFPDIDPQLLAYYIDFKSQMEDVRKTIFEFYSPVDCEMGQDMIAALNKMNDIRDHIDVDEFVKVALVYHYNGAEVTPPPADGSSDSVCMGFGLFPHACRIAHSCMSTSCWYLNNDGWRIVAAICDITAGEEVTVDYTMEALILTPTILRREHLREHFYCMCLRCCSPEGDEMRQFHCSSIETESKRPCAGFHRVCQATTSSNASVLPCNACGHILLPKEQIAHLKCENDFGTEINSLWQSLDSEENETLKEANKQQILRKESFSTEHYLCYNLAKMKFQIYSDSEFLSDLANMIAAKRHQIDIIKRMVKIPTRQLAFHFEVLAETYLQGEDEANALVAYEEALHIHRIVSGISGPYTACIEREVSKLSSKST
jgi:hypothetical protein